MKGNRAMAHRLVLSLLSLALLAGCSGWGESPINPATWFDRRDRPETLVPIEERLVIDNRPLVAQVNDLALERTPGGVIARATGLPPSQGFWQGAMILEQRDGRPVDGVLSFQFRVAPPVGGATASGAARGREVVVARFLTNQELAGVSEIRVVGETNIRSARP